MFSGRCVFICSTEYTVLNALNLVLSERANKNLASDIVIFNRTEKVKKLSARLKKSSLFNCVSDYRFINNTHAFLLALVVLFPRHMLNYFFSEDGAGRLRKNRYDFIVAQSILYAVIFKSFNKKARVYLLEEGLSSYTGRTIDTQKRSMSFRLFNSFFLKNDSKEFLDGQFLYQPEFYAGNRIRLLSLPVHDENNSEIYNEAFDYQECEFYKSCSFVYLGAPLFGLKDLLTKPSEAALGLEQKGREVLGKVIDTIDPGNFVYRPHPLEKLEERANDASVNVDYSVNMWEVQCQNGITDEHVIVSFFSTGAFTPKLLHDKEPYVIFLYNILDAEFFNADKLIDNFRSSYRNPEKIIQIRDLSEIEKVFSSIRSSQSS
jgi:hypothetical protein